jgi:hypothetical protein
LEQVLGTVQTLAQHWEVLATEPVKTPAGEGRRAHVVWTEKTGASQEAYVAVVSIGRRTLQVVGWAPHACFAPVAEELRAVIESLSFSAPTSPSRRRYGPVGSVPADGG